MINPKVKITQKQFEALIDRLWPESSLAGVKGGLSKSSLLKRLNENLSRFESEGRSGGFAGEQLKTPMPPLPPENPFRPITSSTDPNIAFNARVGKLPWQPSEMEWAVSQARNFQRPTRAPNIETNPSSPPMMMSRAADMRSRGGLPTTSVIPPTPTLSIPPQGPPGLPQARPPLNLPPEQLQKMIGGLFANPNMPPGVFQRRASHLASRFVPPVTNRYSNIVPRETPVEEMGLPGSWGTQRPMPQAQAAQAIMSNPEMFKPGVNAFLPGINRVRKVPPGSPEDIAKGIAFERMKFVPPFSKAMQNVQAEIPEEVPRRAGVVAEPTLKEVRQALAEPKKLGETPGSKIAQAASEAEYVWNDLLGGMRGTGGKIWRSIYESGRGKDVAATPKEWFMKLYTKYTIDPAEVMQKHSREGKIIGTWKKFLDGLREDGEMPGVGEGPPPPAAFMKPGV